MSRIQEIEGVVTMEAMAPMITINWNPLTNGGSIMFNVMNYLAVDGVLSTQVAPSPGGAVGVELNTILPRQFALEGALDPVTGAALHEISGAGVMMIIKAAFDTLYAERPVPPTAAPPSE